MDTSTVGLLMGIFLSLALGVAILLVATRMQRLSAARLLTAAALVIACLLVTAILPWNVPVLFGVLLAVQATALAVRGGNPVVRWVLRVADGGKTEDGPNGGILVELMAEQAAGPAAPRQDEILRGGTTIGYLERLAAALGIIAGFPAVIAVIVALKGVGRFTELATPAARERFIVGTLASLLWACAVAGIVPLAVW
ncbi:MAG: hypothetical protein QM622_11025 [Microbacterium sp.]